MKLKRIKASRANFQPADLINVDGLVAILILGIIVQAQVVAIYGIHLRHRYSLHLSVYCTQYRTMFCSPMLKVQFPSI